MRLFARSIALLCASVLAACSASEPRSPSLADRARGEFSFAVVTRTGLHRHGSDVVPSQAAEAARTQAWLSTSLREPQNFPALRIAAAAPELLFVCGDVTESGMIGEDWPATERMLDELGLPWFAAAGQSDMQLTPLVEGFDKRFGGLVYSFDRSGAHFIALCSATACDPRPSFSPLQLNWLREDLARNDDRKPVFLFVHHAPDDRELSATQTLELRAACDGHEIAVVFFGSGSGLEVRRVGGFDCVRAGAIAPAPAWDNVPTDRSTDDRGYVLVAIESGVLRVAHRSLDGREPRLLLEKRLRRRVRAPLRVEAPEPGAPARDGVVELAVRSPSGPPNLLLDAEPKSVQWKRVQDLWRAELPTYGMDGGAHQLAILCDDEGTQRVATCEFLAHSDDVQMRWRRKFAGSLRSAPVWAGGNLAVASTAGEVTVLDPESGNPVWSAKTAAVIGRPLGCDDGTVVVSTAKGWIEAYGRDGSLSWRFQAGRPVFAALAGDGELVFAADAGGDVHALEISTGARRWKGTAPASHLDDPPRVADGRLLLVGEGLELALDIRTGAVLERTSQVQPKRTVGIEEAGKIAKVSDSGLVELLDSANAPLWSWRATAGTAVFAPPLLRADGTVWVAAMDGSLSCVRAR